MPIIAVVTGTYTYENIPSKGEIGIVRRDEKHGTVYASWAMYSLSGQQLAGRTRTYFLGIDSFDEDRLIAMVVEDLKKCRSDRTYFFHDIVYKRLSD